MIKKRLSLEDIASNRAMKHFILITEKKSHKDKSFHTEFSEKCFSELVNSHEKPVTEQLVKENKKHKKKSFKKHDNESHNLHKLCIEHLDKNKSKQNRTSLKLYKENLLVQQDHFIDTKPLKEEKTKCHKKKKSAMKVQDEVVDLHENSPVGDDNLVKQKKENKSPFSISVDLHDDSTVKVVADNLAEKKTKKKKHKNNLPSTLDIDLHIDLPVKVVDDNIVKQKKKKHKNKSTSTLFEDKIHMVKSDSLIPMVDQFVKGKKKKHSSKTYVKESQDEETMKQDGGHIMLQVTNGKSIKERKKKHKHKLINDLPLKKQKKKHKTKIFSTELAKNFNVQHDSEVNPVEEPPLKKRKKNKTSFIELDKALSKKCKSEGELVNDYPFMKQKKRHRINTISLLTTELDSEVKFVDNPPFEKLSTECETDFNVQHELEIEPIKEDPSKKQKKPHKPNTLFTELAKDLAMQFDSEVSIDDHPFKNQKKRHKTETLSAEFNNAMQFDVEVKTVDDLSFKKRHKTNKITTESDKDLVMQLNLAVEPALKKQKKKHKDKILRTDLEENLFMQFKSKVESVDNPRFKKQKRKHKTKTLCTEFDQDFDLEIETINNPSFKKRKKKHKTNTECNKDLVRQLDSEIKLVGDLPVKKQKKKDKYKTFCIELDKNLVYHNSEITVNDIDLKKQKNRDKINIFTQFSENQGVQLESVNETAGDTSLKNSLHIEHINDKPTERKKRDKTIFPLVEDDGPMDEPIEEKQKCDKKSSSTELDDGLAVQHYVHVQDSSSMEYDQPFVVQLASHVDLDKDNLKDSELEHDYQPSLFGNHESADLAPVNNESEAIKVQFNLMFAENRCTRIEPTTVTKREEMLKKKFSNEPKGLEISDDISTNEDFDSKTNIKFECTSFFKRFYKDQHCNQPQENKSEYATAEILSLKNTMSHKTQSKRKKLFNIDKHQSYNNDENNSFIEESDKQLINNNDNINLTVNHFTDSNVLDFDFTDEPADFEVPLLHSSETTELLKEEERRNLNSKNVVIKMGKWSLVEDSLLKRNYENFENQFHIRDPQLLLGIGQKRLNKNLTKFLRAKHFYVRLGKDLNDRQLRSVYRRARLLFDPVRDKDKYNEDGTIKLKKTHLC